MTDSVPIDFAKRYSSNEEIFQKFISDTSVIGNQFVSLLDHIYTDCGPSLESFNDWELQLLNKLNIIKRMVTIDG
jgi:hypothetical protein